MAVLPTEDTAQRSWKNYTFKKSRLQFYDNTQPVHSFSFSMGLKNTTEYFQWGNQDFFKGGSASSIHRISRNYFLKS